MVPFFFRLLLGVICFRLLLFFHNTCYFSLVFIMLNVPRPLFSPLLANVCHFLLLVTCCCSLLLFITCYCSSPIPRHNYLLPTTTTCHQHPPLRYSILPPRPLVATIPHHLLLLLVITCCLLWFLICSWYFPLPPSWVCRWASIEHLNAKLHTKLGKFFFFILYLFFFKNFVVVLVFQIFV